jgi:hypothetical protein
MPCRATTGCTRAHADTQLSLFSSSFSRHRHLSIWSQEKKQPKKIEKKRATSVASFSMGVTEDGITENAIDLVFFRTGK